MDTIDQINKSLLELMQDVKEFENQSEIPGKEMQIECIWKVLCQSRTFDYQELGNLLARILTIVEGREFYATTRLLKHSFQVNENVRPFYQVVSFITDQEADLKPLLLEHLSATMMVYYINSSPVIRPLAKEMTSIESYENAIKLEIQNRRIDQIYVDTTHTISGPSSLEEPTNAISMSNIPFTYLNDVMEQIIVARYQQCGAPISREKIDEIAGKLCAKKKQLQKVVNL